MRFLVIGGADSGKSEYAESLAVSYGANRKLIYLATMLPCEAASDRIAAHRKKREGKGFHTVECGMGLNGLKLPGDAFVLVEDVPNLVANEYFSGDAAHAGERLISGITHLFDTCRDICFVTGDCASGGDVDSSHDYLKLLGRIQCLIASRCDRVTEVVAGIPIVVK